MLIMTEGQLAQALDLSPTELDSLKLAGCPRILMPGRQPPSKWIYVFEDVIEWLRKHQGVCYEREQVDPLQVAPDGTVDPKQIEIPLHEQVQLPFKRREREDS